MTARLSDEQILAYLDERPDLIARYLETTADDRPSSDVRPFDATGKIAANARAEARRLSKANQSLLDAAATNMLHWQALHHATLGFLAVMICSALRRWLMKNCLLFSVWPVRGF